jgi:putative Mn2+ efflux pump MntP
MTPRERLRLTLVLAGFEMAMPVIGFLGGVVVTREIGDAAEWIAIAVLAGVGGWMLAGDDDATARLARTRGWALVSLGVSVSIDELAIGLAIGLLRLPIALVVALIGAQALIAGHLGSLVGSRLGAVVQDRAERIAGAVLIGLAAVLLLLRLTGHAA